MRAVLAALSAFCLGPTVKTDACTIWGLCGTRAASYGPRFDKSVHSARAQKDASLQDTTFEPANKVAKNRRREAQLLAFLHKLFEEGDIDVGRDLDRKEFIKLVSQRRYGDRLNELGVGLSTEELIRAFDVLDIDGSGCLSTAEFITGISMLQDTLSPSDRKLRYSIDGILGRQESLRKKVSLSTKKVSSALAVASSIAFLASLTATLPVWYSALVPAGASALFLSTSTAESTGAQSKGTARFTSARAVELASRGELILAEAMMEKAFVPLGVGVTAVAAAVCVTIKLFIEEEGHFAQQDLVLSVLALFSILGAIVTNDKALRMRNILKIYTQGSFLPQKTGDDIEEFWQKRFFTLRRDPELQDAVWVVVTTFLTCLLPLALAPSVASAPDTSALIIAVAVVVSAAAAAQAALTLVLAEKDFANAERLVAIRCKSASLSELFYAQTVADAAVLPASTALSGTVFAGAALMVEFSRWVAMPLPWPSVLTTLRSSFGAALTKLEAKAAWLEKELSTRSPRQLGAIDVVSSSLREIGRIEREFEEDVFSKNAEESMQKLPVGSTCEFPNLSRDERRKVHMVASKLNLASQSGEKKGGRVVTVTNLGTTLRNEEENQVSLATFSFVGELENLLNQGVPAGQKLTVGFLALAVVAGMTSPLLAAGSAIPLITGGVSVLTVLQEKTGNEYAATAKRYASGMVQLHAKAATFLGRAMMAYSLLPSAFAIATCASAFSVAGFLVSGPSNILLAATLPALPIALVAFAVSAYRLERIVKYVNSAARLIDGKVPVCYVAKLWFTVPLVASLSIGLPLDIARRVTLATAVCMAGCGFVMSAGAQVLAEGEAVVARCENVCSCAEAWAQRAAKSIRLLPFESAAAISATLLSTAFVRFSVPLAVIFELAAGIVCLRAMQVQAKAATGAIEAEAASRSFQYQMCATPWGSMDLGIEDPSIDPNTVGSEKQVLRSSFLSFKSLLIAGSEGNLPRASFEGVIQLSAEASPEDKYSGAAEDVVQQMQDDLDELYTTRVIQQGGFTRALTFLASLTVGCLLVPLLLSELAAEVLIPVVGAGLVLITVAEDTGAQRTVAQARIRAAELSNVVSTMEVLLALSAPYKARLMAVTGFTATAAVVALTLEHPVAHGSVHGLIFLKLVVVLQATLAAWSIRPLSAVLHWTEYVRARTSTFPCKTLQSFPTLGTERLELPVSRRWWPCLVALPPVMLAFLPFGRSFPKRACASTAAGALAVAGVLFFAEMSISRAELAIATRLRTSALTSSLANEAGQQGVVLPLVSSVAIALSALVTFFVEVNPIAASAITIFQTAAWVVASRKGLAARYESAAAMQVDAVAERTGLARSNRLFRKPRLAL